MIAVAVLTTVVTPKEALESLENELLKPYKREENNGKKRLSEDVGRKADSPKQKNLPIYISCEEKSTALALYKREGNTWNVSER